jgi:hypothetical protein
MTNDKAQSSKLRFRLGLSSFSTLVLALALDSLNLSVNSVILLTFEL